MTTYLLIAAMIMIISVVFNKISGKLGVPLLLFFILLGMAFGSDGFGKVAFDNYGLAENICSVALIFIMFYGGFGTKWHEAKPVAVKAILLSSFGTVLTAGAVGLFCYWALRLELLESMLIGAVISSTDAASVFSILRSRRLNLKHHTASLLEIESGSNDPFSYMLTVIILSLMGGEAQGFVSLLLSQIIYGALFGFVIAAVTVYMLKKFSLPSSGFYAIFIAAVAVIAYALPAAVGGNGYLSAYIAGIVLGNQKIPQKKELVHFFDATTGLMQMLLFFLLGLLAFPSHLPSVALPALIIALFLTFIARPLAVFAIMAPFKSNVRQMLLVSFAGMRGAASIVFSIMAMARPGGTSLDIFHMVFFIVLFSILIQGTLLPHVARLLKMTDSDADVMKTFNDYMDEIPVEFIQISLPAGHPWVGRTICEINLPRDLLFVLVTRGRQRIVPNGKTELEAGDTLIVSGKATDKTARMELYEKHIEKESGFSGRTLSQIPLDGELAILLRRGDKVIIPKGDTVVLHGDILVLTDANNIGV